jgi:hypothetical protein
MSSRDTSYTTRYNNVKAQLLANFHAQNPSKQLEGPRGITRSSLLTEMKLYQGPLEIVTTPDTTPLIVCGSIDISTVATYYEGEWIFNTSFTIDACQSLTIPTGKYATISAECTITNNGTFTYSTGNGGQFEIRGIFINNGTFNNNGYQVNIHKTFTNSGIVNIIVDSFITMFNYTFASKFYNLGTVNNSGSFTVGLSGGSYNSIFYSYAGGQFNNIGSLTITSPAIFNNANGGACGTATLTNTGTITGVIGTACPP